MTKIKKKRNKLIFIVLAIVFFQSQINNLYSNEVKCKKFDIKCKTNKFIDDTKEFQKKGFKDGKKQLNKTQKEITLNSGRFGPYLKCENKSARLENVEDLFSIGLNRAITLIADAKPGRISSSLIKDLGEHPEDKKPVRIMKGQYGPYIKYKSLNATIPEEKDPTELTMEEALILIEKRKEYDKTKKKKK